jgi:hypothetical protein
MVSPIAVNNPPRSVENMHKYDVTLKLCTLLNGVPYGPALIEYTHPESKGLSF